MNTNRQLQQAEKLANLSAKSPALQWLIELIIKNPQILITIIQVISSLVKFALGNFFTKDGKARTPWWVKLLGGLGVKPVKEIKQICLEACEANEKIDLPDIY